eukprot:243716_1
MHPTFFSCILIWNVIRCYGDEHFICNPPTVAGGVFACSATNTDLCDVQCGGNCCRGITMACNNAHSCNLLCHGDYSCQGITFESDYAGYINIICNGTNACYGATFELQDPRIINIDCYGMDSCNANWNLSPIIQIEDVNTITCHDSLSCHHANINANLVHELNIQCDGSQSCSLMNVSAIYVDVLNINCIGDNSCTSLHAQCLDNIDRCTLNCNGLSSCTNAQILCPMNLSKCHIDCHGDASCTDLVINVIEYYPLEQLDIGCTADTSCTRTTFQCWNDFVDWNEYSEDQILFIFIGDIPQYKKRVTPFGKDLSYLLAGRSQFAYDSDNKHWDCGADVGGCCPYYIVNGRNFKCPHDGTDCSVHCDNPTHGGCAYHTINGAAASALHVTCFDDSQGESCKNALIICPVIAGDRCVIECQGSRSCENVKIYGGNVNLLTVICAAEHDRTCYHTNVYGEGVALIQVFGIETGRHSDILDSMRFFNVFANTAEQIHVALDIMDAVGISIHGAYARINYQTNSTNTSIMIYADHSPYIEIEALAPHSLELHADNAGHVEYTIYENKIDYEPKYPNALALHLPELNTDFFIININKTVPHFDLFSLNGISDYTFTLCHEWNSTGHTEWTLNIFCNAFRNASSTWRTPNGDCIAQNGNCCDIQSTDVVKWVQCIPTVSPTSNPITRTPTVDPTTSPSIIPTVSPIIMTTGSPSQSPIIRQPIVIEKENVTRYAVIVSGAVVVLIFVNACLQKRRCCCYRIGIYCWHRLDKYINSAVINIDKALVLIIGVSQFKGETFTALPGIESNVTDLRHLWFDTYNYTVKICNECTKRDIINFMDKHLLLLEDTNYKAVIVHLLSHGTDNDGFITSDLKTMHTSFFKHELITQTEFADNTELIKLIFHHACRGSADYFELNNVQHVGNIELQAYVRERRVNGDNKAVPLRASRSALFDGKQRKAIDAHSNCVVLYGTIEDRALSDDGLFTESICEVFGNNSRSSVQYDLNDLIKQIRSDLESRTNNAQILTSEGIATLTNKIRFQTCINKILFRETH